jgi:putative chitinase
MKINIFSIKSRFIHHKWIAILLVSTIYFSCRKIDQFQSNSLETLVTETENRFFQEHSSSDATVLTLTNFIKQKNITSHFVLKTVERLGYPYWDKALFIKQDIQSSGVKSNNTSVINTDTPVSATSTLVYIPFVRDQENYVNAALVFLITPTDTLFQYVCDWQYKVKPHGPIYQKDITAESYALFFMMLNRRTLGHSTFKITDKRLFPKGGLGMKKLYLKEPVATQIKPSYYVGFCEESIICGSPNYSGCQPFCDWANCAGGDVCYRLSTCTMTWINPWNGGSGSGDGSGDSSGSGGGSSGGGGSNEPPDCSDPENKHQPDCEEGWEPVPTLPCPITKEDLKAAFPLADTLKCRMIADLMNTYGPNYGIDTKAEIQMFLAQCAHETGSFSILLKQEDLYYRTPERLVEIWDKIFSMTDTINFANPRDYLKNSMKLANKVYGGINGNTLPGDGYKFRGRGAIQLTGKENYMNFQTFYNLNFQPPIDVIANPDLMISNVTLAMLSAMHYFQTRVLAKLPPLTSTTDVRKVTRLINVKLVGLADRIVKTDNARNYIICH